MSQILCRDLSLGYDGQTVCEHVDFTVEAGDCLCIVGDNGSGKSTLMRALLNLKAPTSGEILFGDGIRQSDIGYLPQQNDSQKDFPASVWEVVLSGCVMKEDFRIFAGKKSRESAKNALREMGDELKAKLGEGVVVLASAKDGKVNICAMATDGAVKAGAHAGNIIKAAAQIAGGGGGGRPNAASAGGKDPAKIPDALAAVPGILESML